MKTLDRLIGSVVTGDTPLSDTTSNYKRTPTVSQDAGTKFVEQGENWTARTANRVAGALALNIDTLATLLDGPSISCETLFWNAGSGVGTGQFGWPSLYFEDTVDILDGSSYPLINLGLSGGSPSHEPPATWVYVGLLQSSLAEGKYLKFYRDATATAASSSSPLGDTNQLSAFSKQLLPAFIQRSSTSDTVTKYHGTQNYIGNHSMGMPDFVPPITEVVSDISPYNGSNQQTVISSWDVDGPVLSVTLNYLHVRPGSYLKVEGTSSGSNDGIWYVKEVIDSKAVLTRGPLVRVTVSNGASFTAGQMVAWQEPPNHTTAGSSLDALENRAYVMFISGNDLWLARLGAPIDTGSRVSTESVAAGNPLQVLKSGKFGSLDQETGFDDHWVMPIGTRLYPVNHSSPSTSSETVSAALPSSWPAGFDTSVAAVGTATPMNPPGFLLNPVIGLPLYDAASKPSIVPGNYYLQCRTLTTVKERLLNSGGEQVDRIAGAPSELLPGLEDREYQAEQLLLKHLHLGSQAPQDYEHVLNHVYSPTRKILGSSLYLVEADTNGDGSGTGLGIAFESGTLSPGDVVSFTHATADGGVTKATVVWGWGTFLLVRDAYRTGWTNPWQKHDYYGFKSIDVSSTIVVSATTYTATATWYPKIHVSDFGLNARYEELQPPGLNAEYWGRYSSDTGSRAVSAGIGTGTNEILQRAGEPQRIIMGQVTGHYGTQYVTDQDSGYPLLMTHYASGTNLPMWGIGWDTGNPSGSTARLTLDVWSGKMVWKDIAMSPNEAAVWDWSSGTHLQLHPDANRLVLAEDGGSTQKAAFDTNTDSLGFEDVNTGVAGTPIYLSDTLYNDMAPDIQSGGSDSSIAGAIYGALLGGADYASVSGGVLQGGTVTATAPTGLTVDVSSSVYVFRGRRYGQGVAATAATITDNSTAYLAYTPATQSYVFDSNLDLDNDSSIYLAKVTAASGNITEIVSCKQMIHRVDHRVDITVGNDLSANPYYNNFTNFASLGEALAAIGVWSESVQIERAYIIHVIGDTVEVEDATLGLTQPYALPIDGLRIIGHAGGNSGPRCQWSNPSTLIDLNSKDGTHIENLDFAWASTTATHGINVAYAVFTATGSAQWDATIKNCRATAVGGATTSLEAFFAATTSNQGGANNLTIEGCYAEVTNAGVLISGASTTYNSVHIANCEFVHSSSSAGATDDHDAISVDEALNLKVIGNKIATAGGNDFSNGIEFFIGKEVLIKDNTVASCSNTGIDLYPHSAAAYGDASGFKIVNNTLIDCGITGIVVDVPNSIVSGNVISGGCSSYGIKVGAENVAVTGNRLNTISGQGIRITEFEESNLEYGLSSGGYRSTYNVRVSDNTLIDTGTADTAASYPIRVTATQPGATCERCIISGNQIDTEFTSTARTTLDTSISIDSSSPNCVVTGNMISGNFKVQTSADRTVIDNNKFLDCDLDTIVIDAEDALVSNNVFIGGAFPAIKIDSTGSASLDKFQIINNRSTNLASIVDNNSSHQSTGCDVSGNVGFAVITLYTDDSRVSGNVASNGSSTLTLSGEYNVVTGNVTNSGSLSVTGNYNVINGNNLGDGGIDVNGDANGISNNYVGDDQITLAANSTGCRIIGNNIARTTALGSDAISVGNSCTGTIILGNVVQDEGVSSGTNCDHSAVLFNSLLSLAQPEITWDGDYSSVSGNVFKSLTGSAGIVSTGSNVSTCLNLTRTVTLTGDNLGVHSNVLASDLTATGDNLVLGGNLVTGSVDTTGSRSVFIGNLMPDGSATFTVNAENPAGTQAQKASMAALSGNNIASDMNLLGGRNVASGNLLKSAAGSTEDVYLNSSTGDADLHNNTIVGNKSGPVVHPGTGDIEANNG